MKKIFIIAIVLVMVVLIFAAARAASFKQVMGYGLSSSTGVALRVNSEGAVYLD